MGFDPQIGCTSEPRYSRQWETKNIIAVVVFGILAILSVAIEVASVIELSEASGWVAAGLFMTEG